ncbi:MAG: bifunctional hydroxymethylpyrimidine kinase/phosphomethylpyrimidine kinase [Pseudomonadota bacterium]
MQGRVLIIAGSDSSGGAGIQADIKTCTALGAYAATAITAVTVQDTNRVYDVHSIPPQLVRRQIDVVLSDLGADCIKIGMIGSVAIGQVIRDALVEHNRIPVVLDPVLVATSGDALGHDDVAQWIREELLPLATVLTPNIPELSALSGHSISSSDEAKRAAAHLLTLGAQAVLAKGGHLLQGADLTDHLITASHTASFTHPRITTTNTHGTGCTLASAVAAGITQGMTLEDACRRGVDYVHQAIKRAPGLGQGHGPLGHDV